MRSLPELGLLVLLVACGGDDEPDGTTDDTAAPDDTEAVDDTGAGIDSEAPYDPACDEVYTWTTVGAPFVYSWCTGCHSSLLESPEDTGDWDPRQGAPESINFDSLEAVCSQIALIESAVFGERMPPSGGPSDAELDALRAWIDCGPPECEE